MTLAAVAQVAIAFTGLTAVALTQTPRWARFACWFGLAGEPAWFYSSTHAHQWGIFTLAFFYTFAWGKGVYTFWYVPYRERRRGLLPCGCYVICTDQLPGHPSTTFRVRLKQWP